MNLYYPSEGITLTKLTQHSHVKGSHVDTLVKGNLVEGKELIY